MLPWGNFDSAAGRRAPGTGNEFADLLDAVHGIRWPSGSAVRSGASGAHNSRLRGTSAEFTEYRPYRQGDDLGRIDWKLFARSDRAYIRLSNDRAVLPTTIVLDASASMAFPVDSLAKWKYAAQIAVGLAAVARNSADPVGLVIAHTSEPVQLPPRTRQSAIHEVIRAVSEIQPGGDAPLSPSVSAAIRVSGRVVVITDFLGDSADLLVNAARAVAGARELHAIHIVAPEEMEPSRETRLVADPEQPDVRRPLTEDARVQYLTAFSAWRDNIAHDWSDAGVSYTLALAGAEEPASFIRRVTAPRGMVASV